MESKQNDDYSLTDIMFFIKSFLIFLRGKLWLLVLAGVIGAGTGVIYYNKQEPKYVAVTTFILEEKGAEGGGLSGLASQFGVNFGMGGGSIFSGDNIFDILESKKIVKEVLLTKLPGSGDSTTLADLYLDFTGIRLKWQNKHKIPAINFAGATASTLSPLQDSVLTTIYEAIVSKHLVVERINKKGSIIKVEVKTPNNDFGRLLSIRLVKEASALYMGIRTSASQANIQQLQRRSDSLLVLLNRKSYAAAASDPLDLNPAFRTAVVPTEIASRDKAVLGTLYGEVTKNLEANKLLLSQQMPVIQILDQPDNLLKDNRMSMPLLIAITVFLSLLACFFVLGIIYLLRSISRR
jgi:hypothetical protein